MDRLATSSDHEKHIGLIGIDLADFISGYAAQFHENNFDWQGWILETMGRRDIWFADAIHTHLWLYAVLPSHLTLSDADDYLRGLSNRLQKAIDTQAGGRGRETLNDLRYQERGIGFAVLSGWNELSLRSVIYEGVMKVSAQMNASLQDQEHWNLQVELDRMLKERSIKSVYQPITKLADGKIFGYESLTRCPEGSLFDGPLALFKFAERHHQDFALDRLARETAIRYCPELETKQKIFMNVSMGIMNDPHFVSGQTVRWLQERGLKPDQVVLELTERSSIDDFNAAKKILVHYRDQGYEIAIDDAGAGYSSLQSIVELNPDYIKVDRSLISNADQDEMKKHMLRTFIRYAKRMNIRTVAEGIERPEELRLVRAIGFDYGQGYLLGRPSEKPVTHK